jgi:hypothetical protein
MSLPRIALSAVFTAVLAAVPLAAAQAQYYPPPCTPFPLTWPFCIAGAVVGTAAQIVTTPFRAVGGPYYSYPPPYQTVPAASYYPAPGYYPPPRYYPPPYYGR